MDEQQILAAPYPLDGRDKRLKFGLLTTGVMAIVTAACKLAAFIQHRENLMLEFGPEPPPDEAQRRAMIDKEFRDEMTAGLYGWGGEQQRKWRTRTSAGRRILFASLLESGGTPLSDDDLSALLSEKPEELAAIMAAIEWDSEFPKAPRPAKLTAALKKLSWPTSSPCSSATPSTAAAA